MSNSQRAPVGSDPDAVQPWYVDEGKRAERLLDEGHLQQASEAFEAILGKLGDAPSYGRAVLLGQLSRCSRLNGHPERAVRRVREAMDVMGRLAPSDSVKSLRGRLRSELGDALRALGEYGEAKKAYEAALGIAEDLNDLRGQGIEQARLGTLASTEGRLEEALQRQESARRIFQQLHEIDLEAGSWQQLARIHQQLLHWDEAESHYREAARINTDRGRLAEAAQSRTNLAGLLQDRPGRLVEARQLAAEAFDALLTLRPTAPDTWKVCGLLADMAAREALASREDERRVACELEARDLRELQRHASAICATFARVGPRPTYGRAVMLGQLGRSLWLAGRPDLALAPYGEAIAIVETLGANDGLTSLRGALLRDVGDVSLAVGRDADARAAHEAALTIAEGLRDVQGQASASERLGRPFVVDRPHSGTSAFGIDIYDDLITEYAFEPDLLVDGPRERRVAILSGDVELPDAGVRPVLSPFTRTWVGEDGAVRLVLLSSEPLIERHPDCTVVRRRRRELAIAGDAAPLWRLVERVNGASTVAEIISAFSEPERPAVTRMLATLAAAGVIDVSGRAMGRFVHLSTKKGVLPAGGLEGEDVLRLATDGTYRTYPGAPRLALGQSVPPRLRAFHALTRERRSSRVFGGGELGRGDFDALLHTACGTTGSMFWAGREVKLRAYPSSGALYAVEIYPVVFRVEGLGPGVYHYRAIENELEVVTPGIDRPAIVGAVLPAEREMVAGAAAMVCLTGCFPRHERKYGEGGYRMMVAEAGHISQNLILAAAALGLSARPFGGVFDDLLNSDLGLNTAEEQFLLAVLVGPAVGS